MVRKLGKPGPGQFQTADYEIHETEHRVDLTEEGQELVDGVKQKAVEVKDRATGAAQDEAGSGDGGGKASAGDDLTDKERKLLRKLIKDKLKDAAKADPSSKAPPKK